MYVFTGMKRILIVDDDQDFRRAIRAALNFNGFKLLEAKDSFEAIALFKTYPVDAVIMDMKMPRGDGIEATRELKQSKTNVPVIILSAYGTIPDAVRAMQNGATDFLQKPPDYEKLALLLKQLCTNSYKLTLREREILSWIKEGKTNSEISMILNISESTVKTHLKNLFAKLDVVTRAQAIHVAMTEGLLYDRRRVPRD